MFRQNWGHAEILKILATLTDNLNALSRKVFEIKFCIYEQFFPNVNWQIFGQPFRDNSKFQIKNTLTNCEDFYSKFQIPNQIPFAGTFHQVQNLKLRGMKCQHMIN